MKAIIRASVLCSYFFLLTVVNAQTKVNILTLYDEGDEAAKQGITAAIEFLNRNPAKGIQVNKHHEIAMKPDESIETAVENSCAVVDKAITDNEPPHSVVDLTKIGVVSETAKSFTRSLGLPTFAASYGEYEDIKEWMNLSEEEKKYLVRVLPPGDILLQSIRDMASLQNMTNVAILYDDSFEMDFRFKSLLRNMATRHIMVKVKQPRSNIKAQLGKLKSADLVNYFLVGKLDVISQVLDEASALDMNGRKYAWYTLTKELEEISCGCKQSKIMAMNPMLDTNSRSRLNRVKGSYGLTAEPIIDAAFYFNVVLRGILATGALAANGQYDNFEFTKCTSFDEASPIIRSNFDFKQALQEVNLEGDTWDWIIWGENGMSYPAIPLEINKFDITRGKIVEKKYIGRWEAGIPGQIMKQSGVEIGEFSPARVLRLVTVVKPPFMYKEVNSSGTFYYGYLMDLLEEVQKYYKFEYELYEVPDGRMGTMNEKMEWDGIVGEIVSRRADIAWTTLSVMAERESFIDFTVPYYDLVGVTILMKKIKPPTSLFKFLTVLKTEVWICILVSYLLTSVMIWLFDYFSPTSYQNAKEKYVEDEEKRIFTAKEGFWFCMTSLTPQGGGEAPKNISGRFIAATWWLFGFIIIASYTANLAAFLTVSRLDTPITSMKELSSQYKIQYSTVNGSDAANYFERMAYIETLFYEVWKDISLNDSLNAYERSKLAVWEYPISDEYTNIWQTMRENRQPNDFQEGVERVRSSISTTEGFALVGDGSDIRYMILTNCNLQDVGTEFTRKPYALAVQEGSPLKQFLNDAILELLNERRLETLKERWWYRNPFRVRCDGRYEQTDGISIENIGGVFIVICAGILLALIVLLVEYWWYKGKRGQVTDSGRIVAVQQAKTKGNFSSEKSNFKTEYNPNNYDIAPVPNPW